MSETGSNIRKYLIASAVGVVGGGFLVASSQYAGTDSSRCGTCLGHSVQVQRRARLQSGPHQTSSSSVASVGDSAVVVVALSCS